jgi:hypothetical protein
MIPVVLGFQTILWLALLHFFVLSRNASIFHPFFFYLIFHGIVFVLRPILEYSFGFEDAFDYMWFFPTQNQIVFSLFLTSSGLVAIAIFGWLLDRGVPHFDRPQPPGFNAAEWRALVILFVVIGPVAMYSVYLNTGTGLGGGQLIGMDRDPITGIAVMTNTTGYFTSAEDALIPCTLMLIWATRFRPWSFVPLGGFLLLHLYLGWGRWAMVLSVLMLGLLILFNQRRRWAPLYWLVAAIPVFLIFHQLGQNRDYFYDLLSGEQPEAADPLDANRSWVEKFDGLDFANFDYLTYIVDVVPAESETYSYFTQYLQLFTEPIPRILWPEKPYGSPIDLVNLNNYGNFVGLTQSLVGDGWVSAGWIGVVITLGFVGFVTSRLHRWFWSGEATNFKVLAYCTFLPLTIQWFRDGGISITKFALFTVGPLVLWRLLVRLNLSGAPVHVGGNVTAAHFPPPSAYQIDQRHK